MTGFWPGFASFVVSAVWLLAANDLIPKLSSSPGRAILAIAFATSLCCATLGVFHALVDFHYVDMLGAADAQGMATTGKRGVALILISVWPFAMIVIGLLAAFSSGRAFQALSSHS